MPIRKKKYRLKALDHFETVQMDSFLKALAAEMFTDESNALSLVYYAACNGLYAYHPIKEEGSVKWEVDFTVQRAGYTPVELLKFLAEQYKAIHLDMIRIARYYGDVERAKKLQARNSISNLGRILFYNDPENRFQGTIEIDL